MKMSDKLCSTDAVPLGKEPQVLTEKQADGVKCVRDLRSLHWGLAKVCDTRIPVLVVHWKDLVLLGCIK